MSKRRKTKRALGECVGKRKGEERPTARRTYVAAVCTVGGTAFRQAPSVVCPVMRFACGDFIFESCLIWRVRVPHDASFCVTRAQSSAS